MSNAVAIPQTFEQKLKDRIRDSMGELMSEDDLKKIVEASVNDILFKVRQVKYDTGYGGGTSMRQEPPLIQEILTPLIKDMTYKVITEWAKEPQNQAVIEATIKERLGKGITDAIAMALDQKFNQAFFGLQQALKQAMGLQT
jgi:hypothetical protein